MADEQYRWLDRETAERLLSGEPFEAVDAAAREQAEQLAETLGALAASPPLTSDELPGEAAALAAFRAARAERDTPSAAAGRDGADAGVVRLGGRGGRERRRWGRPARLGLAAALAAGMVGGVAVAAGTGVLPSPFRVDEPEPAASVSGAATEQPSASPSPAGSTRGGTATPGASPDGTAPGTGGGSRDDEAAGDGRETGRGSAPAEEEQDTAAAAERTERIASACRDMRDGKELSADRKRVLEGAAGSATRVWKYCEGVLADIGAGQREDGNGEGGSGQGGDKGRNDRSGSGEQGGKGGGDNVPGSAPDDVRRTDGAASLPGTSVEPTAVTTPAESSALGTGF